jgi:hypothetical protein
MKNNIKSNKNANKKNVRIRAYVGQKVIKRTSYGREAYIIAQVAPGKVCLISTVQGNRWDESVEVKEINCITKRELNKIGVNFMLDVLPEAWGM